MEKLFYRDKTKFCSELFCKDLQTDLDNYFSHRLTNFNELFNSFVHTISPSYIMCPTVHMQLNWVLSNPSKQLLAW